MAVGIFVSGLGALTVLDVAQNWLPEAKFIYFADSSHVPYGVRNADDIHDLTRSVVHALWDMRAALVILACNTASAAALRRMQEAGVPDGKRVLGVFVPRIEALTERQWGDNYPPREVRSSIWRFLRPLRPWLAGRSSASRRFGQWRGCRSIKLRWRAGRDRGWRSDTG